MVVLFCMSPCLQGEGAELFRVLGGSLRPFSTQKSERQEDSLMSQAYLETKPQPFTLVFPILDYKCSYVAGILYSFMFFTEHYSSKSVL